MFVPGVDRGTVDRGINVRIPAAQASHTTIVEAIAVKTRKCVGRETDTPREIYTTREEAQVVTTTIVETIAVETRKVVGRETDTPRKIDTSD